MQELYDDAFKAMADPHRRQIMAALCERAMMAGDLARLVKLAPNAVSFHLKWLKSAGLVAVHRQGKFLRYQVVSPALAGWREHVSAIFPALEVPAVMAEPKVVGAEMSAPLRLNPMLQASPPRLRIARPTVKRQARRRAFAIEEESLPTELL